MTIFYPDVSPFQGNIGFGGAPCACLKVTEGTGWPGSNAWFSAAVGRCHSAGCWPFAYHFLHAGNTSGQASFCHSRAGSTPLMLDFEPTTGSRPGISDGTSFVDSYRRAGGVCNLLYLPHWYWQQIGSPSLKPFVDRGMHLVASAYTAYDDHGSGWAAYGGMNVDVWQYTDRHAFNGQSVDFNAYKGSLAQLQAMVGGKAGPPPPPPKPGGPAPKFPYGAGHYLGQPSSDPYCHSGYYGGPDHNNVHTWQVQMHARKWDIVMDGKFGPASDKLCRAFQAEKGLTVDGKVGAITWDKTWTAPVTA